MQSHSCRHVAHRLRLTLRCVSAQEVLLFIRRSRSVRLGSYTINASKAGICSLEPQRLIANGLSEEWETHSALTISQASSSAATISSGSGPCSEDLQLASHCSTLEAPMMTPSSGLSIEWCCIHRSATLFREAESAPGAPYECEERDALDEGSVLDRALGDSSFEVLQGVEIGPLEVPCRVHASLRCVLVETTTFLDFIFRPRDLSSEEATSFDRSVARVSGGQNGSTDATDREDCRRPFASRELGMRE